MQLEPLPHSVLRFAESGAARDILDWLQRSLWHSTRSRCASCKGRTLLHAAAAAGQVEAVMALCLRSEDTEDLDMEDDDGMMTVLMLAATAGHVHVVRELLQAWCKCDYQR